MTVQMRDHSNVRSWEFSCTYRKSLLRILLSLCSIFLLWNFQSREQYEDCDAINSFMSVNQILTKGWTFAFFFTKLVDRVVKFRLSSIWIPRSLTVSSFLKKKKKKIPYCSLCFQFQFPYQKQFPELDFKRLILEWLLFKRWF